jgi:hypothetical protein
MEIRISNLKTEFNNISLVRSKIINVFESLKNKSDKLKNLYSEFIKQSNTQLFVFGLDSFHFQSKLIDLEYDDMRRIFLFVNNRMYCEYFKLYKLICSYVIENISDKKILEIIKGNNFPVYKDLEPFKDYKFETTMDIHHNILILLNSIAGIVNNRENELSIHRSKQLIGLNIDNFVNSFNYEIILMKEKINLFLSYIEFFHKLHSKYLKRFSNKIQLMSNHVNSDIQFDETSENDAHNTSNFDDHDDYHDDADDDGVPFEQRLIDQDCSKNNNSKLNTSFDLHDDKNDLFEDYENGINTPSNSSYKSTESQFTNNNKKMKMPKFIKNGFKKVSNMITGCNNTKAITNELVLEKLTINHYNDCNEALSISLNDFNDNVSEGEVKLEGTNEDAIVVEDSSDVILDEQTDVPTISEYFFEEPVAVVEEPVVVVEEPVVVVEEPVVAVEEPVVAVEEPVVAVAEEPVVVVEEPVVAVEEPVVAVEEPLVVVAEEPVVVAEEPIVVVEEPIVVVEEPVVVVEEPVVVVEEPLVVVAEEPVVVAEEPVVVVEEPGVVVEEPLVVVAEEPVVVAEEPVVVVEEPGVVAEENN